MRQWRRSALPSRRVGPLHVRSDNRSTFSVDDHLDALDAALADLGLTSSPLIFGAHSMGSAIAVAWAARLGPLVQAIVCNGTTLDLTWAATTDRQREPRS